MLEGVRVQAIPAGETEAVRVTVPVNPNNGETVTVDVPATPALTLTAVGFAATEKSGTATLKVTVAV